MENVIATTVYVRDMYRHRPVINELYEEWIDGFSLCPVLSVPSDDLDFVLNPDHLKLIADKVLEKLQGREEVVFGDL